MKQISFMLAVCYAAMVPAMTFNELQSIVANATDGTTVYVNNDIEYDGALTFPSGTITLKSPDDTTNRLTRAAAYTGTLISLSSADTKLTISNLEIDGNRANGAYTSFPVNVGAGELILASGADLHDFHCDKSGAASGVVRLGASAKVTLQDGAMIRDSSAKGWGVAVILHENNCSFNMEGGLITGCDDYYASQRDDYGGTVYIYRGIMRMTGGVITGNRSTRCVAGVDIYAGQLQLGGDAAITNNTGGSVNDICVYSNKYAFGSLYLDLADRPFNVRATVRTRVKPVPGERVYPNLKISASATTAYGLSGIACEQWPEYVLDGGMPDGSVYPVWAARAAIPARGVSGNFDDVAAALQDGDTLELTNDVLSARGVALTNGLHATINGHGHRLLRHTSASSFCLKADGASTLRLEDVTVDGNGGTSTLSSPVLQVYAGSRLELGSGAVIENMCVNKSPGLACIQGSGTVMTIEDGSVIRNSTSLDATTWGFISIGNGTVQTVPPRIEMTGGCISNNILFSQSVPNPQGYGGAIYCFKGNFIMSGGEITGNVSTGAVGGVNIYSGTAIFSGTARVRDNRPAVYPDVCLRWEQATGLISGDFHGNLGLSLNNGKTARFQGTNDLTGACRLFDATSANYGNVSAYCLASDHKIYFYAASDWIDGIGCPPTGEESYLTESVALLAPTSIDLEKERSTLPHVFKGERARTLSGMISVSFDPTAYDLETFTPITLLHAEDGAFTGSWTFTLPASTDSRGLWAVRRKHAGTDYVLDYRIPKASTVFVR